VENRALWSEQGNPLPFADAPLSLSPNETGGASIRGVPGFPPNPLSPPLSLSSFLHTLSSTPTTPLRTRKSIAQPLVFYLGLWLPVLEVEPSQQVLGPQAHARQRRQLQPQTEKRGEGGNVRI
jgi:hypothetical protein